MKRTPRLTINQTVRLSKEDVALLDKAAAKMTATLGWKVGRGGILRVGGMAKAKEMLAAAEEDVSHDDA